MKKVSIFAAFFLSIILFSNFNVPLAKADTLPNFTNQLLASGLNLPTDFAATSDGRIFITTQNGGVRVFKNGQLLTTPAITINVGTGGDRGLVSLAFDPNFSSNSYVYFLYTSSTLHERISRFTVTGDTINPASEVVLFENPSAWGGFLNAGAVRFGPDGKIYASLGSNGAGTGAQDISSLEGKMVRINADGTIPADNPFFNTPGAQKSIYAIGFRNPWRFNFGSDGKAILGDVGESAYEKIVRIVPGGNYGWPTFEGDCRPNCGSVTPPILAISHTGFSGLAVVGGNTYSGGAFPSNFNNNYFFGDYVQGYIKNIVFDGGGNVSSVQNFASALGSLSAINIGSDGALYYLTIFPGELHKITYGGTLPVTAVASADKTFGTLPLTVQFGSASSTGSNLSFSWNFGDGTTGSGPSPTHTYNTKGIYTAVLTVSNGTSNSSSNIKINAGYLPPTVQISAPAANAKYSAGDTVFFSGSATDSQDGQLGAQAFSWSIIPHHNVHIHTPTVINGVTQGNFTIPRDGEPVSDTWYEIKATVTDSVGIAQSNSVSIYPNLANLTLNSNPSGLQLLLDGQPVMTPYQTQSVVGINRTLGAVSPQTLNGTSYQFTSWSDGGAQSHAFVSPANDTAYVASFTQSGTTTPDCATPGSNTFTGCYYDNIDFTGTLVTRNDSALNFDWGGGSPDPKMGPDTFSARWQGNFNFENADYDLTMTVDDGARLYIDGVLVLDKWFDQAATTYTVTKTMTAGMHLIKMEYYENYGNAVAKLSWVKRSGPQTFTDSVTPDKTTYNQGDTVGLTTTVRASNDVPNVLVDTEIYDTNNNKVRQNIVNTNLIGNQNFSNAWQVTGLSAGQYLVKMGVFANDWSKLYYWDNTALSFTVGNITPPVLTFAVSASMTANSFPSGATAPITTNVTATANVPNVHIHTEIYDSNNLRVGYNILDTSLNANQQSSSVWNAQLPTQNGTYTVKVGVFSGDYSTVYFWKNNAFQFSIGTPPGPPVPGQTYQINLIVPTDNATVSGVVEIKANIVGLDINTYNIGWRTGNGPFFNLDTEPVLHSYKHAWIDFGPWNWNSNNVYPLEFQATDSSGHVIGGKLINVTVTH